MRLDFRCDASIAVGMADPPVTDDYDAKFDRLLNELEAALDLAARADRDERLAEIAGHCAAAAQLTANMLARRLSGLDFGAVGSVLVELPAARIAGLSRYRREDPPR